MQPFQPSQPFVGRPPKLPCRSAKQTHAYNQFLRACHHRQIAHTGFTLHASQDILEKAPLEKAPLLMTFSFQNQHPIKIGLRETPFIDEVNSLCAPWTLPELSPELARAALTHILNDKLKTLPENIQLKDWHLNISPPKDFEIHIGCALKDSNKTIELDVWTHPDFPFSQFSTKLALNPSAEKIWPPQLYLNFPVDIAAASIAAKDLSTLKLGDVIFLSPRD